MINKRNYTRKPDRQVSGDKKVYGMSYKRDDDKPLVTRTRRGDSKSPQDEKSETRPGKKFGYEKENSFNKPGSFRKPEYERRPVRTRNDYGTSVESEKSEMKSGKNFSYEKRNSFNKPGSFRKPEYERRPVRARNDNETSVESEKSETKSGEKFGYEKKNSFNKPSSFRKPEYERRPVRARNDNETSIEGEKSETKSGKIFGYEKRKSFNKPRIFKKTEFRDRPIIKKIIKKVDDGLVRLNKIIASSGICSRREADVFITSGLISVNGKIITELGTKVSPSDDIRYNGERMKKEKLVYILLNKPKDYITTLKDPYAKRTVLELIKGACKERVYPVGRLDRNTTGVLLLTNDGDMAKKLSHPSHNRKKIYHVYLDKNLRGADVETISVGIELEDGFIKADEINFVDPKDKKQVGIEIHSGRNRIVRRIFEHLGYKIEKLNRVYFSGLTKKGLQRGEWRFLTEQEIVMLKMGSYE